MPKYDIFKPLHLLSFVERLHIKYKPGTNGSETCRTLYLLATSDSVMNKFPKLQFSYEITSYDCLPEIIITVSPNKNHIFGSGVTISEIQRQIDQDQYLGINSLN